MIPEFRNAGPNDAEALAELGRRSFTETFGLLYTAEDLSAFLATHSAESWAQELADPAFAIRIGEVDGKAMAYAKLGPPKLPFEPRGEAVELRQFYVLSDWHGSGAASELMRWVLDEARRRGGDDLYLSVFVDNARAQAFYAKYGFVEEGRYAFMVGTHADEDIVMRLAL
jgi:ribosomal protein S18 acetylase RimI-like enzyme